MKEDKLKLIEKTNPELRVQKVDFIESGFHSLAIIINDDYVFRFPLEKEFFGEYKNENKLLKIINKNISTKIPSLKLYDINGEIFTKHKLIKGEQYTEIGKSLTENEKIKLAKELSKFVMELHKIKTNEIEISQFSISEYINSDNINILHNYLKDRIKEFDEVLENFENESQKLKNEDIVVCHNDLNENNILINAKTKKLAGIIDFGNAVKRDFSSEFASLLKHDFAFTLKLINEYEKLADREVNLNYAILLQKIRCYGGMAAGLVSGKNQSVERSERWLKVLNDTCFLR